MPFQAVEPDEPKERSPKLVVQDCGTSSLRQMNVTEDGQEWRSVTCRSATGSPAGITRCSFLLLAMTTLSCAMTASALISTFHDPWRNEMPLQASGHDHR